MSKVAPPELRHEFPCLSRAPNANAKGHGQSALAQALRDQQWENATILMDRGAQLFTPEDFSDSRWEVISGLMSGLRKCVALRPHGFALPVPMVQWLDRCLQAISVDERRKPNGRGVYLAECATGAHCSILERFHAAGVDWDVPVSFVDAQPAVLTVREYLNRRAVYERPLLAFLKAMAVQEALVDTLPEPSFEPHVRRPRL